MPSKPAQVSLSAEAQADADWYIGEGAFIAADDFADELDQALSLLNQFTELGGPGVYNTQPCLSIVFPIP